MLSREQRAEEFSLNAVPTLGSVTIVMGMRGGEGGEFNFAIRIKPVVRANSVLI